MLAKRMNGSDWPRVKLVSVEIKRANGDIKKLKKNMLVLRQNLTISTRSGRDLTGSIEISSDLEEILVGLTKISSDLEEILLNRLRSPQIFNYDAENHMDLGKVRSLSTVEMRLERRSKQRKLGSLGGPGLLVSQNFKSKPKLILSVSIIDDP